MFPKLIVQAGGSLRCLYDETLDLSPPRQVKDLWSKVAELLGDEPTQLERDALAIPPVADE